MKLLDKIRMHSDKLKEWGNFAMKEASPGLFVAAGLVSAAALVAGSPAIAASLAPVAVAALGSSLVSPLKAIFGSVNRLPDFDPNKTSTERICRYVDFVSKAGPEAVQNFLKEVTQKMSPERLQTFENAIAKAGASTTIGATMQNASVHYLSVKPEFAQTLQVALEAKYNMPIQAPSVARNLTM